jgi:hypothetical protein
MIERHQSYRRLRSAVDAAGGETLTGSRIDHFSNHTYVRRLDAAAERTCPPVGDDGVLLAGGCANGRERPGRARHANAFTRGVTLKAPHLAAKHGVCTRPLTHQRVQLSTQRRNDADAHQTFPSAGAYPFVRNQSIAERSA